jgi:UDP-N-acetylmuramyl pentapeptide synthase
MKELGLFTRDYHEEIAEYIDGVDLLVTCGVEMKNLHKLAKNKISARHFETIEGTEDFLSKELKKGDVALIKGSHGSNMYKIVDMLSSK